MTIVYIRAYQNRNTMEMLLLLLAYVTLMIVPAVMFAITLPRLANWKKNYKAIIFTLLYIGIFTWAIMYVK